MYRHERTYELSGRSEIIAFEKHKIGIREYKPVKLVRIIRLESRTLFIVSIYSLQQAVKYVLVDPVDYL